MRRITLEEHIITDQLHRRGVEGRGQGGTQKGAFLNAVAARLSDITEFRLPEMDSAGIDVQVLSVTAVAEDLTASRAMRSNDELAEIVAANAGRFEAFAALPCQEPRRAADELERCVRDLGFKGALIRRQKREPYFDHESCWDFWERAEELQVPIYLHPNYPAHPPGVLEGYPELAGSAWGWGVDTASHVLRLVFSGVFERFPQLTVILGHMGECLPYALWRLDDRWSIRENVRGLKKKPSEYIRQNIVVTTAGVCDDAPLVCALAELGAERVMLSVDYPYQSMGEAVDFLDSAPIGEDERGLICHGNAERLLRL